MIEKITLKPVTRMFLKAFAGESAEFPSNLPRAQALSQLQVLIKWSPGTVDMVGSVSDDAVELGVLHTFMRSNNTRFHGQLKVREEYSELVGVFKSSAASRYSMAMALAFLSCMLFGGLVIGLPAILIRASNFLEGLKLVGFLSIWMAGVCLMGWLTIWNASPARGDVMAITAAIREALHEGRKDLNDVPLPATFEDTGQ